MNKTIQKAIQKEQNLLLFALQFENHWVVFKCQRNIRDLENRR